MSDDGAAAPGDGPAPDFVRIFDRDLDALARQVGSYPDDESLWRLGGGIRNPAGTLAAHLVGNLEHFVGAVLGGTGYVRDRDREFSERPGARSSSSGSGAAGRWWSAPSRACRRRRCPLRTRARRRPRSRGRARTSSCSISPAT